MYLFFLPKSQTEILKLMPQRRHASELWDFSAGFHPAFIRLIRLNREQCSIENRSDTNIFRIFV